MLYFKKNTFFRKIKVDGCTIAHISVEDRRPQEISEKEFTYLLSKSIVPFKEKKCRDD